MKEFYFWQTPESDHGLFFPPTVPPPKFFAYINPVQVSLDPITCLWLNAFALNLQQSVTELSLEKTEPPYLDVKVEAIMFRVNFKIFIANLIFILRKKFAKLKQMSLILAQISVT